MDNTNASVPAVTETPAPTDARAEFAASVKARKKTTRKPAKAAVPAVPVADKLTVQILVLPPQRSLPTGHMLRVAMRNGQVIGATDVLLRDEREQAKTISAAINKAAAMGFSPDLFISARCNYKTVTMKFRSDPLGAVNDVMNWAPRSTISDGEQQELPF